MFNKWGTTTNGTNQIVQLDNIASINDEKNDLQDKIIVSLIKTEEEPTLKNGPFYLKKNDSETKKHNPAIFLNLYLLFSVTKKNYKEGLQLLSDTILFFQAQKVFEGSLSGNSEYEETFKVFMDLHDIPMQEVFELWSNLGNKQFPFIIYKARVVKLIDRDHFTDSHLIKTARVLSN
ncbi:MAG TPA: DUF4255 domain-containing protein [Pricia sp.]|nr:DUF4255 domain-containing protein [Pricia sp.]